MPEYLQRITVHASLLGGGFGRRNLHDFVIEAVQFSRTMRKQVKLIWSREEDMQHDFYHPATLHRLRTGLSHDGLPVAWEHRIVGSPYASGAEDIPCAQPTHRDSQGEYRDTDGTVALEQGRTRWGWRARGSAAGGIGKRSVYGYRQADSTFANFH